MAKIMLIGDSITAYMPNNLIGSENDEIINKGIENIGSDTYRLYCFPKLDMSDVDICVLLIGVNNILRPNCDNDEKTSLQDAVKKIKDFIADINRCNCVLMVQSIYPTNQSNINKHIQYLNEQISEYCYLLDLDYLDFYDLLSDSNGLLKENYSDDGIHPNDAGYSLIANQINEYIKNYTHIK